MRITAALNASRSPGGPAVVRDTVPEAADDPPGQACRATTEVPSRGAWEALADAHLGSLTPYLGNPDTSLLLLPGKRRPGYASTDGLEGFARTCLLLAFRTAQDPAGPHGVHADLLERYRAGLTAGPAVGGSWPRVSDRSQSRVEAAGLAVALWAGRRQLWDPLPQHGKEQLLDWLSDIDGKESWPNNQQVFGAVVNAFRGWVGAGHDEWSLESSLAACERLYLGNGWYSDGPAGPSGGNPALDWYNAWAFHYYLPLVAVMTGRDDLRGRYAQRLEEYLPQYLALFADDGTPVPYGRSLSYRYAVVAPCWTAPLLGLDSPTPAELAAAAGQTMAAFHGPRLENTGSTGLPARPGWRSPGEAHVQTYTGPGSTYWLAKAFLGLVLSADHPAWAESADAGDTRAANTGTSRPDGAGIDRARRPLRLADGRLLVSSHDGGSTVQMHPVGAVHDVYGGDPAYHRLTYSTLCAPGPVDHPREAELVLTPLVGTGTLRRARDTSKPGGAGDLLWAVTTHTFRLDHSRERVRRWLCRLPAVARATLVTLETPGWTVWVLARPSGLWREAVLATPAAPGEPSLKDAVRGTASGALVDTVKRLDVRGDGPTLSVAASGWFRLTPESVVHPRRTHAEGRIGRRSVVPWTVLCWRLATVPGPPPPEVMVSATGAQVRVGDGRLVTVSGRDASVRVDAVRSSQDHT